MKINTQIFLLIFALSPFAQLFAQNLTLDVPSETSGICSHIGSNLSYGNKDDAVSESVSYLQNYLYGLGFYPHEANGEYGWATHNAVIGFQKENNLPRTGFFGPLTREIIRNQSCTVVEPIISSSLESEKIYLEASTTTMLNDLSVTDINAEIVSNNSNQIDLPYIKSENFVAWKQTWGSATTSVGGGYVLSATASTTGAEAFLSGSENWTDYSYTIDFIANRNGSFSLLGRFVDENNFLACTFSGDYVYIQQRLNGKSTTLSVSKVEIPPSGTVYIATHVNMKALGSKISCSATGAEDVTATVTEEKFLRGGIGLSIWHSVANISMLDVKEFIVTPI